MITSSDIASGLSGLDGDIFTDNARLIMYSTDASAYRERPLAVIYPKSENDIIELVRFAAGNNISLIPRTAGTSLAGQVVGSGIVVDVSRYMNAILEVNPDENWVRVQPGVILDELNLHLKPHRLFFSPETSTSNRSMIGGMIGNNSCGLHSLIYGATRDHTLSVRAVLSDASVVDFGPLTPEEFRGKCMGDSLENRIYREMEVMLNDRENQAAIIDGFPDPAVKRRNTGYALDELLSCHQFLGARGRYRDFNMCRIIAGSEGTIAFITEARLHLDPLKPQHKVLVPVHFHSVMEAIRGNLIALRHHPSAVELMDKTIMDCTKENISQRKNRFFIEGDPGAMLIVEFMRDRPEEVEQDVKNMREEMQEAGLGYHFPVLSGPDIPRVWALRKAGLGVLSNLPGDGKPVSVIEDTSVSVEQLEPYITDFNKILDRHNLQCVYHAHISVGELHLRPVLNLKDQHDVDLFHDIALETAQLVKKYRGSLSGEHGDGRLRGEFIPLILGEHNYQLIRQVKELWDPGNVFNAGKIIDSPPMNNFLRYEPGNPVPAISTYMNFEKEGGIVRLIEKCNGSGDCRKTELTGGTMCPSYMASRDEAQTTRARANILREMITMSRKANPFDHREIYDVLDLCLSCKACKSECPSNVDMAKLKAEFLQHWHDSHGIPLRTRMIANIARINKIGGMAPALFNFLITNRTASRIIKLSLGFAGERTIPAIGKYTFRKWISRHLKYLNNTLKEDSPEVLLYIDEFTDHNDVGLGITTVKLLNRLGIRVIVARHPESARSYISKGLLKKAGTIARKNIEILSPIVSRTRPLVGIEPSAILGFRDEIPDLVGPGLHEKASILSENCLTIEEFLADLADKGVLSPDLFTAEYREIRLHGHCQQKAIASTSQSLKILSVPENYSVKEIPSGCCGMAGSFGYEKEHYELSLRVGELVLFPAVRNCAPDTILAAPGTSCRHQIFDGTGRTALHPVEILYRALR